MIRVQAAGYHAISILHGGPNTQLRKTMEFMGNFGIDAKLFDPWARFGPNECDIFHLFAANIGTYHLANEIRASRIPIVTSPIFFRLQSPLLLKSALAGTRLVQKAYSAFWSDLALTSDICKWSVKLLPNSQEEGNLVSNVFAVDKLNIAVIPNGVDDRFLNADPTLFKKQFGIEDFILNVGHIGHERKNVFRLIQALGKIDHPSVIIGRIIEGEYGKACVEEAKKYRQIRVIDGLPNDSDLLVSAYAAADTFVLPSLFETPGIAALEAGLAGAKVVITPHGGPREYFGEMAEYVNPTSVKSIRNGIVASLQKKKANFLRERIRQRFLWQHVAEATANVYKQVYERKQR